MLGTAHKVRRPQTADVLDKMKSYTQTILKVIHACGVLSGVYALVLVAQIDPAHRIADAYYQQVGIGLTLLLTAVLALFFWFLLKDPRSTAAASVFVGVLILSAQWFNAPELKARIIRWDLSRMGESFIQTYIFAEGRSADTVEGYDWNDSWVVAMDSPEFRTAPQGLSRQQIPLYEDLKARLRLKEAEYEYWMTQLAWQDSLPRNRAFARWIGWAFGVAILVIGLVGLGQIIMGVELARTGGPTLPSEGAPSDGK